MPHINFSALVWFSLFDFAYIFKLNHTLLSACMYLISFYLTLTLSEGGNLSYFSQRGSGVCEVAKDLIVFTYPAKPWFGSSPVFIS
jgi:hypothetical protein